MAKNLQDTVTLNNGIKMPWFGLGVFKVEEGSEVIHSVRTAIKNGYRLIDTAAVYQNEEGVGKGIREGMKEAGTFSLHQKYGTQIWDMNRHWPPMRQA
jgi:diketogulonate reductase-like aldo/keto reductase